MFRRRALVGDAIAHSSLPGVCIAFLIIGSKSFAELLGGHIPMVFLKQFRDVTDPNGAAVPGASVVVNDLGGSVDGEGASRDADVTVELIRARGGTAIAGATNQGTATTVGSSSWVQ